MILIAFCFMMYSGYKFPWYAWVAVGIDIIIYIPRTIHHTIELVHWLHTLVV